MDFKKTFNPIVMKNDNIYFKNENMENLKEQENHSIKKLKKKSKKRKHKSIRRLMKDIMKPKSRKKTQEIQKEKIMKNMGGGKFSKIEKI